MRRTINPPKDQWDLLPTSLTTGERAVAELFDAELPSEWEMYVQPHLNGLRPDFILLNPAAGIAVFEVKDWTLGTLQDNVSRYKSKNPILKVQLYEEEIYNLYCPRLNDSFGMAAITSGLIFTKVPQAEVDRILFPTRGMGMRENLNKYPFSGSERVEKGNIVELFPEYNKWGQTRPSKIMSTDTAEDLRGWLRDPDFSQDQRKPLNLNADQREIETERTASGYRRVKGPAGSGKSLALAARATRLASLGKRVLVCSYNITLMNYHRDLVARHARTLAKQRIAQPKVVQKQIEFRHFHGWCKWICTLAGYNKKYTQLWSRFSPQEVLNEHLAGLVTRIYADSTICEDLPMYDAILVDEGQDFRLPWWQTLRNALKPNGEMLLVADKTQNVYGTAAGWTEQAMGGAGFYGPWKELKICYRLPSKIIPVLKNFADDFLLPSEVEVDLPTSEQPELGFNSPLELRWVQVCSEESIEEVCFEEVQRQMQHLQEDTAISDIIFLVPNNAMGLAFVERCEQVNIKTLSTFGKGERGSEALGQVAKNYSKSRDSRRRKLSFFLGDARTKVTTLHSFKGWEARHLVVYVSRVETLEERALFYTALTRLKSHPNGSKLTIVSTSPDLSSFGCGNFPDFDIR